MDDRAKISVSLSDELKARLDAYAEEHQQPVSLVVQEALQRFLDAPGEPAPPPHDSQLADQVEQLRRYVSALAHHEGHLRSAIQLISQMCAPQGVLIPCPPPLAPPPWE